ncbi:MAG: hypothetical protein M0Z98_02585 [Actinomycetales bacterium]|nr:hypothetical protein [Actinomycetales bacterium]
MITGAAFVPSTPMLVPAVASGAAAELADVRDASLAAVRRVLASGAERVVVLGAGREVRTHFSGTGSLRGLGVDLDVPLDPAAPGGEPLPLALTIGAWLLAQAGWPGDRAALELDPGAGSATIASVATALANQTPRSALLVVADGSAARSERAPASLHPDAEAFDADVAAALASGHPHRLAEVDRDRAAAVSAQGWPAWHAAAVALAVGQDAPYDAEVLADVAPYGVGYLVAAWTQPA